MGLETLPRRTAKAEESLTKSLDLTTKLPTAVQHATGGTTWAEYGIVEHEFATANPDDFARFVDQLGHRAVRPQDSTVSSYLARRLADLGRQGLVAYHHGPATGRWSYDTQGISWWAVPPAPDWASAQLSWADSGLTIGYVPGQTELT